jgi:hypothetical protein
MWIRGRDGSQICRPYHQADIEQVNGQRQSLAANKRWTGASSQKSGQQRLQDVAVHVG